MLFHSIDFALFLPAVFIFYWFVFYKNLKVQNLFLVAASYVFYGWWDWRFLSLLAFTTLLDYVTGLRIAASENKRTRKVFLWVSIIINLSLLGVFKYYNFFADSFASAFLFFGAEIKPGLLHIVLPVGISFYTFQSMSYAIDVYRRKLQPTRNLIAFAAYVSFFPQLVAGPIERATRLLPQFYIRRQFEYAKAADGMRQIIWGLFKKLVIADGCAEFANLIFNNASDYSGSTLLLGAVFFAFQIYGDFSGYSDIASGTAKLFGFNLMQNFAFPYFSRDIAEFWRRWHISLTTWFRDYLYIPLGGSRGGKGMIVRNTFIIFIVSGFWHGANMTFIAWGTLHAFYFLPLILSGVNRKHLDTAAKGNLFPSVKEISQILLTFALVTIGWIFFRAETLSQAVDYLSEIFSPSFFSIPSFPFADRAKLTLLLVFLFMCMEWTGRSLPYAIAATGLRWKRPLRWAFYSFLIFIIGMFMKTNETPFIYFQF
jgi:D-alanyl-lipoteichoic acid acyltransferase DltB (MBOAT superfamily)